MALDAAGGDEERIEDAHEENIWQDDLEAAQDAGAADEGIEIPGAVFECERTCKTDDDCDDRVFCNGIDFCNRDLFDPGTGLFCCDMRDPCPASGDACSELTCIEEVRQCVESPLDSDNDGYGAMTAAGEGGEEIFCGGDDCDDGDGDVHPGAAETCDGKDNDCDFAADEEAWSAAAGSPVLLSSSGARVMDADIAGPESEWIVVWSERDGSGSSYARAARCGSDGEFEDAVEVPGSTGAGEVEVVTREDIGIVLFWIEGERSIRAARYGYDGDLGEAVEAVAYSEAAPDSRVSDLEAALRGNAQEAAVLFRSQKDGNNEIYMLPVDLTLPFVPPEAEPVRLTQAIGFSGRASCAPGDREYLVAWEDERDGNREIYCMTIDYEDGRQGPLRRLTLAPGDSSFPAASASEGGFRVFWMDESAGTFNIVSAMLDAEGAPLGSPISCAPSAGPKIHPAASSDPREPPHINQHLAAYVLDEGGERRLMLTAAGESSPDIHTGIALHATEGNITAPVLSEGSSRRAILWIEGDYAQSSLFLMVIECMDG